MRPFSLLIKPASSDCNLHCTYCFYLDTGQRLFPATPKHRMSGETLEKMIRTYLQTEQPVYSFAWQGGEPTLMGLDFFKEAVSLQNHYRSNGAQIVNVLQTNGTLLHEEWAAFLARYRFLVGISLDGPESVHNTYRLNTNNSGSYKQVLSGLNQLKRYRVEYNTLTLVSRSNVSTPLEIYRFLRDEIGSRFHQYIECVEYTKHHTTAPFSITATEWGDFLCTIFDEWYQNDREQITVRLFDSILSKLLDNSINMCSLGMDCRHYLVVEHNGDLFPCDFYVTPELKIGNIHQDRWGTVTDSESYGSFGIRKSRLHQECTDCPYLVICAGDCQKNRAIAKGSTVPKSVLCKGWLQFYNHTFSRFQKLAEESRNRGNSVSRPSRPEKGTIRRNAPCPCGSGKKYKKCCMGSH